jgi:hypothetical protein
MVDLFINQDNMPIWRPSLRESNYVSGLPGRIGATRRLVFQKREKKIYMEETVLKKKLPELYKVMYKLNFRMKNYKTHQFKAIDENRTKWILTNEYFYTGLMQLFGYLLMSSHKKQTKTEMMLFKIFAESQK